MTLDLAASSWDPWDQTASRWVAVGLVVIVVTVLLYAFVTRYHEDWDALLRKWTGGNRHGDGGTGAGPPDIRS
jgi:hypothetical protein